MVHTQQKHFDLIAHESAILLQLILDLIIPLFPTVVHWSGLRTTHFE